MNSKCVSGSLNTYCFVFHGAWWQRVYSWTCSWTQRQHSVKYHDLHEESALIAIKVKDRWMGCRILDQSSTHMEDNRALFHLRHGFPTVGAAMDGTNQIDLIRLRNA